MERNFFDKYLSKLHDMADKNALPDLIKTIYSKMNTENSVEHIFPVASLVDNGLAYSTGTRFRSKASNRSSFKSCALIGVILFLS